MTMHTTAGPIARPDPLNAVTHTRSGRRIARTGSPLGKLLGFYLDWRERRRTRRHLDLLDDRLLRDVGLERHGSDYRVTILGPASLRQIDWRR